jgi:site-specific DNA-methyltransferase (adenine-specific)
MKSIPKGSVDMILCDLPYGTTRCRWDAAIPLDLLWEQYKRVIKYNGAIVLFSTQPFTSELIMSNRKMYRYEWIWHKTQPTGYLNAKKMPLRVHENIEVFYKGPPVYNPQMTHGHRRKTAANHYERESDGNSVYGHEARNTEYDSTDRYPVDVQRFSSGDKTKRLHVTQKPLNLLEYLILTYTRPGETVLDNCMGSGSTGVACLNTGRDFIGIELDPKYFRIAKERIERHEMHG